MTIDELHELARSKNFKGLAAAFARADLHWHEEEWRAFIGAIEQAAVRKVLERVKIDEQYWNWSEGTPTIEYFNLKIDAELAKLEERENNNE